MKSDFGYYSSKNDGEQFLANVRIKSSEIKEGTSVSGKVFLKVYKNDVVRFDEVNCTALFCLPIKDVSVVVEELPIEISVKGYDGKVESKIKIEEVSYSFDKSLMTQLKITIMETKTFGTNSSYDIISYKLYDSNGYVADTGNIYLSSLSNGSSCAARNLLRIVTHFDEFDSHTGVVDFLIPLCHPGGSFPFIHIDHSIS